MDRVDIRTAGEDDAEAVFAVITLAFTADPLARWATPDPAKYLASMPQIARAFAWNGAAHGGVHLEAAGGGAAMWLPPGVEPDADRLGALTAEFGAPERSADLGALLERMEHAHPTEPHWYLPLIGVDPAAQGRGIGSALMARALARCDADGATAYLESTNPRNVSLYLRHGFEAAAPIQVGTSPPILPMLRRPQNTNSL